MYESSSKAFAKIGNGTNQIVVPNFERYCGKHRAR